MERVARIMRKRPWYRRHRKQHLIRLVLVLVVMVALGAGVLYRMVTSIPAE